MAETEDPADLAEAVDPVENRIRRVQNVRLLVVRVVMAGMVATEKVAAAAVVERPSVSLRPGRGQSLWLAINPPTPWLQVPVVPVEAAVPRWAIMVTPAPTETPAQSTSKQGHLGQRSSPHAASVD